MKIALVNPAVGIEQRRSSDAEITFPLALGYLAAYLLPEFRADIYDSTNLVFDTSSIIRKFDLDKYDVVGLSAYTHSIFRTLELAQAIKSANPGVRIVLGGYHVSVLPTETLRDFPCVDCVVCFEGEHTFKDLVRAFAGGTPSDARLASVNGIAYRTTGGDVVLTPPRTRIADLDSLPFPVRVLNHRRRPHTIHKGVGSGTRQLLREFSVHSSRGCPYNCSFCAIVAETEDRKWRARSVDNVLAEIQAHYNDNAFDMVNFSDANFFMKPERAINIAKGIQNIDPKLRFAFQTRSDLIIKHKSYLKELGRLNCAVVCLGAESMTVEILKKYGKRYGPEENITAAKLLRDNGIRCRPYIIMFDPDVSMDGIKENVAFFTEYESIDILSDVEEYFGALQLYPGTKAHSVATKRNAPRSCHEMPELVFENDEVEKFYGLVQEFSARHQHELVLLERKIKDLQYECAGLINDGALGSSRREKLMEVAKEMLIGYVKILHSPLHYFTTALDLCNSRESKVEYDEVMGSHDSLRQFGAHVGRLNQLLEFIDEEIRACREPSTESPV
jgi:radical SAM superfamily enzyme YgiQ (UPF0313 family)